jgi:hypothetical protein
MVLNGSKILQQIYIGDRLKAGYPKVLAVVGDVDLK